MVMNQVTLLCAESFNDVSLLGALTSCPLLKERGYQTEILYCGDENDVTKEAGDAVSVIRLKLDSLKEALLATKTKNLLLSFIPIGRNWVSQGTQNPYSRNFA